MPINAAVAAAAKTFITHGVEIVPHAACNAREVPDAGIAQELAKDMSAPTPLVEAASRRVQQLSRALEASAEVSVPDGCRLSAVVRQLVPLAALPLARRSQCVQQLVA